MMNKYFMLIVVFLITVTKIHSIPLINNSGTSSDDSLTVAVLSLDSLGNPSSADSFFVVIFKSGSNSVVFSDSGNASLAGIDTVYAGGEITYYYYHRAVSDIDGSGASGQYSGIVTTKNSTLNLLTMNRFSFQIIDDDFSSLIDSLYAIIDTLQNHNKWVMVASDTINTGDTLARMGSNQIMNLRGLHIRGSQSNDTALIVMGVDSGIGIFAKGGNWGEAIKAMGGDSAGHAVQLKGVAPAAVGLHSWGSDLSSGSPGGVFQAGNGNSQGLQLLGSGSGAGLSAIGGQTGVGIGAFGGSVSGHGFIAQASNSNSNGLRVQGSGSGAGLVTVGGSSGYGTLFQGGVSSGHAFQLNVPGSSGNNIDFANAGNGANIEKISDQMDSVVAALSDAAKVNYRADVGALSTFDPSITSVVIADTNQMGDTVALIGSDVEVRLKSLRLDGSNGVGGTFSVSNSSGVGVKVTSTANFPALHIHGGTGNPGALIQGGSGIGGHGVEFAGSGAVATYDLYANSTPLKVISQDTTASGKTIGLMPGNWSQADSLGFQGEASGLTANSIWSYSPRTITGGMIDSNLTEQGGITGGNLSLTIYAVDTSDADDTVDAVLVTLQNSSGVAKSNLITTSSGKTDEIVTAGDWRVLASKHGYSFPDTIVSVSTNDTIAVLGYDLVIPPPSTGSTCRVYAYLYDLSQMPEEGAIVSAKLVNGVSMAGAIIVSPYSVRSTTDSSGYFYLDLIPSDSLDPSGSEYEFSISRRDGTILRKRVTIPAQPTWRLIW